MVTSSRGESLQSLPKGREHAKGSQKTRYVKKSLDKKPCARFPGEMGVSFHPVG